MRSEPGLFPRGRRGFEREAAQVRLDLIPGGGSDVLGGAIRKGGITGVERISTTCYENGTYCVSHEPYQMGSSRHPSLLGTPVRLGRTAAGLLRRRAPFL